MKGSFTGAYRDKLGKLQTAHRGTLFLDEVGEMSLRMQAMLLRFLENGEIQAVGADTRGATVDVRVIAATNRNLPDLIAAGQFREDLLYRLRVIHLEVPPLRDRRDDIRCSSTHFIDATGRASTIHRGSDAALSGIDGPATFASCRTWSSRRCGSPTVISSMSRSCRIVTSPGAAGAADARTSHAGGRRALSRRSWWRLFVLGPYLPAVPVARHHPTRHARARARGLSTTRGNYRALLKLFGMSVRTTNDSSISWRRMTAAPTSVSSVRHGRDRTPATAPAAPAGRKVHAAADKKPFAHVG